MVCAVGAVDQLVGVSHECDFPEQVRGLPVLTSARIAPGASSRAIDAAVREVIRDALSIYTVDEAKLAALQPDVIVTQDLCEVCAVSLDDVRSAVARLASREVVSIVSLKPMRLGHVWDDVETVATALGRAARGAEVRAALVARVDAIAARARTAGSRPRVVSIEWLDPIMLGGTWMPELIELARARSISPSSATTGTSKNAPAPSSTGSVSTSRSTVHSARCPAARSSRSVLPRSCSNNPTSCCSTSRPPTSTATPGNGSTRCAARGRAACCW
jgi:ABC-type Fe3+-hydroxamate transport system substrate-binding protein